MEDIGSRMKYKQTILQRYLTDSYRNVDASQPVSFDDDSFTKPRMRRQSGSLGSRDYEELSTSSGASVNEYHHGVFDGMFHPVTCIFFIYILADHWLICGYIRCLSDIFEVKYLSLANVWLHSEPI